MVFSSGVIGSQVKASGAASGTEDSYDGSISGFTYASKAKSVASDENNPRGMHFNNDGTSMFVVGTGSDTIDQYTLSTGWDVSTAGTSQANLVVSGQTGSPQSIDFKNDGTWCVIVANTGNVYAYSGDAWDIGSFSYDTDTYNPSEMASGAEGVQVSQDGTTMWILVAATADTIYQYTLSTPWDVSTASYDSKSFGLVTQDTQMNDFAMYTDGSGFVACGNNNDNVFQFSMSTDNDISTASYDSVSFSISSEESTCRAVALGDGSSGTALKCYVAGGSSDTVYQYE